MARLAPVAHPHRPGGHGHGGGRGVAPGTRRRRSGSGGDATGAHRRRDERRRRRGPPRPPLSRSWSAGPARRWPWPPSTCSAAPTGAGWWWSPAGATTAPTGGWPPACSARGGRGSAVVEAGTVDAARIRPTWSSTPPTAPGSAASYPPPRSPPGTPVLAVDIPSGVEGDTGEAAGTPLRARPHGHLRRPQARASSRATGPVGRARSRWPTSASPGGPSAISVVEDADVGSLLPAPDRQDNKWSAAVLVVAGSPGMTGAAVALRPRRLPGGGGHGPPRACPGPAWPSAPATEAVSVDLPARRVGDRGAGGGGTLWGGGGRARASAATRPPRPRCDASGGGVAGAGGGRRRRALRPRPDRGSSLARRPPRVHRPTVVLTPHDGEYAPADGRARPGPDRIEAARRLAAARGTVALLKGPTTAVAEPGGRVLLGTAGTAALATAGTGDVLSGVIGALLARGVAPIEAAALAAHVHGRAAARGPAEGLVAGDLPELVAAVLSGGCRPGRCDDPEGRTVAERWRPAWADIDLDAVRHNASLLGPPGRRRPCARWSRPTATATARLPVARAALEGGATWLAVALVEEGVDAARGRHRGADPPALGAARRRPWPRRWPGGWSRPSTPHGAIGALAKVVADGGLPPARRPPQGRHRHAPGRAPTRRSYRRWPQRIARRRPVASSARSGPTWRWPTGPATTTAPSPQLQLERFDAVAGRPWPAPGTARRSPTRPTRPAPSPFPRPARDLVRCGIAALRGGPHPGPGRRVGRGHRRRAAPAGALAAGRVTWCAISTPGSAPPTAGAGPCRAARRWRPCPSATPTACPVASSTHGWRGPRSGASAGRWPGW